MNNKYVSIDQYKNHKVYLHHEYKIPKVLNSFSHIQSIRIHQGSAVPVKSEQTPVQANLPCKNSLNSIHPSPSISKQLKTNLKDLTLY